MNTKTFTGGCTSPKVAQNKVRRLVPVYMPTASVKKKKENDDYKTINKQTK